MTDPRTPGGAPLSEGAIPLRERRSLAEEWGELAAGALTGVSEVQRVEMRKAFYAGAASMFGLLVGGLDADHEPTLLDVAYVESLNQEITVFVHSLSPEE